MNESRRYEKELRRRLAELDLMHARARSPAARRRIEALVERAKTEHSKMEELAQKADQAEAEFRAYVDGVQREFIEAAGWTVEQWKTLERDFHEAEKKQIPVGKKRKKRKG